MREAVRPGRRGGVGWRRRKWHVHGMATQDWRKWHARGQGTRGAHGKHVAHGRDLGRVEAERLVELVHALPSREAGMRRGKRCRPGS